MSEIDWEKVRHLLGTKSDKDIAAEIGSAPATVARHRARLGIPSYGSKKRIDWEKWISLMGVLPDPELADKIGCSLIALRKKRRELGIEPGFFINWSDWDSRLGKETDADLAAEIGCLVAAVRNRRVSKGISPWVRTEKAFRAEGSRRRVDWSKWDYLLGTDTDYKISKMIGCKPPAVALRRKKLGIAKYVAKD
ncbi:hypothetical protein [Maridesulfovibrio sp.]|uniref:hypothetical protein n=1 Tax=Maridesulfovibrio sp. TaxID=2795000 RepID=UPI0029CA636A|nr:hypothetical protein [Maridesulfovibrio sp.]